jgi:pyruvate-formate lyase-activating enzyme
MPFFDVEASALCDLRCTMCPRDRMTRPAGILGEDTFDRLLDWLPAPSRIVFSGLGEPLLNPALLSFVERLKTRGHTVGLTTNGTRLTPSRAAPLLAAGLDVLHVSLQAFSTETAARLAGGEDTGAVRENLEALSRNRPEGTRVYLSVVAQPGNEEERNPLRRFASDLGFTPHVRRIHSRGGALYTPARVPEGVCGIFPKVTFVAWNGGLLACCNDTDGSTQLGNVADTPFESLREAKRERLRDGRWFAPCAACDDGYRTRMFTGKARGFLAREEGT